MKKYWDQYKPDQTFDVSISGYTVKVYSFGDSEEVVLCLNGGPGLPCDYIRDSHSFLIDKGFRVVAFDQLGTGNSDKPADTDLWRIERYVEEVEAVRVQLDLGQVHLLGQSWGGWLAIEYSTVFPQNLKTLVLENTCADMPHLVSELDRLKTALGSEVVAMMQHHEASGAFDHPEYVAAVTILNYRHVCRLSEWPAPIMRSIGNQNPVPYNVMQGPNEFVFTGNLKEWNRLRELSEVTVPVLITVGRYDEITPACARRMAEALPSSELIVFENSSHQPFFEEPEKFQEVLSAFLTKYITQ